MALYASLDYTKSIMKIETTANATEDAKILRNLRTVSRRVDAILDPARRRPIFEPYREARRIRVTSELVNRYDGTLRLTDPLLALSALSIASTALVIDTGVAAWPDTTAPIEYLRLLNCTDYSWYHDPGCTDCGGPLTVTVTGLWGLHRDYASAWAAVDALTAGITSSATTVPVADADGTDEYGLTPRFSPGDLIKVDDEFMEITAIASNNLTVRRAQNGTTAAAHDSADTVSVWRVEEAVRHEVARQAGLMYARFGAYTSMEVTGMGEMRYPTDLLTSLKATLAAYAYGV